MQPPHVLYVCDVPDAMVSRCCEWIWSRDVSSLRRWLEMNFFLFCKLPSLVSSWLHHVFIRMSCCLADVQPTLYHWKLTRCVLGAGNPAYCLWTHVSVGFLTASSQMVRSTLTVRTMFNVLSVFCWELTRQIFILYYIPVPYQVWYLARRQLLVWIRGCPGTKMSNKAVP